MNHKDWSTKWESCFQRMWRNFSDYGSLINDKATVFQKGFFPSLLKRVSALQDSLPNQNLTPCGIKRSGSSFCSVKLLSAKINLSIQAKLFFLQALVSIINYFMWFCCTIKISLSLPLKEEEHTTRRTTIFWTSAADFSQTQLVKKQIIHYNNCQLINFLFHLTFPGNYNSGRKGDHNETSPEFIYHKSVGILRDIYKKQPLRRSSPI